MIYPPKLQPTGNETIFVDGRTIDIPMCTVLFRKWTGVPIKDTFGGKYVLEINGRPMFAELAILVEFLNDGWETRWVETYAIPAGKEPKCMVEWKEDTYKNQTHQPFGNPQIIATMALIAKANRGVYAGCWDVVAFKDEKIIFSEAKRAKKDRIRDTQKDWLASGLACGLRPDNFLMVQWDFA